MAGITASYLCPHPKRSTALSWMHFHTSCRLSSEDRPEKQGILPGEKCRLALPFTAHTAAHVQFQLPIQTSARGYKRYFKSFDSSEDVFM